MYKFLVPTVCLAIFGLQAAEYTHKIKVMPSENQPASGKKEYIAEVEVKRISEPGAEEEIIATPQLVCIEGAPAEIKIESDDKTDYLLVKVLVPKGSAQAETSIQLTDEKKMVISATEKVKIAADASKRIADNSK
jgi:hypothetical protein